MLSFVDRCEIECTDCEHNAPEYRDHSPGRKTKKVEFRERTQRSRLSLQKTSVRGCSFEEWIAGHAVMRLRRGLSWLQGGTTRWAVGSLCRPRGDGSVHGVWHAYHTISSRLTFAALLERKDMDIGGGHTDEDIAQRAADGRAGRGKRSRPNVGRVR